MKIKIVIFGLLIFGQSLLASDDLRFLPRNIPVRIIDIADTSSSSSSIPLVEAEPLYNATGTTEVAIPVENVVADTDYNDSAVRQLLQERADRQAYFQRQLQSADLERGAARRQAIVAETDNARLVAENAGLTAENARANEQLDLNREEIRIAKATARIAIERADIANERVDIAIQNTRADHELARLANPVNAQERDALRNQLRASNNQAQVERQRAEAAQRAEQQAQAQAQQARENTIILLIASAATAFVNTFIDPLERKYHMEAGLTRRQANNKMIAERAAATLVACALAIVTSSTGIPLIVLFSCAAATGYSAVSVGFDSYEQPDPEIIQKNNRERAIKVDDDGKTELMKADYYAAKELIAAGADINACDKNGKNALMHTKDPQVAKLLIERGANLESKDKDGKTALMQALDDGDDEKLKILIAAGADVNVQDENKKTVLMRTKSLEIAKLLIERGANLESKDKDGKTALMQAISNKNNIAELLIEKGANVHGQDSLQRTLLMFTQSRSVIKLLLEKGLNINAQDKDGNTALMHIVENNQDGYFIRWFIEQGANVHIKNKRGRTAHDIAQSKSRWFFGEYAEYNYNAYKRAIELLKTEMKK